VTAKKAGEQGMWIGETQVFRESGWRPGKTRTGCPVWYFFCGGSAEMENPYIGEGDPGVKGTSSSRDRHASASRLAVPRSACAPCEIHHVPHYYEIILHDFVR